MLCTDHAFIYKKTECSKLDKDLKFNLDIMGHEPEMQSKVSCVING